MKHFFKKVLRPYIVNNKYKTICEIGASWGGNTNKLLQIDQLDVSIIDPCFEIDLANKYQDNKRVKVFKGLSLDILPQISKRFDCILVDGAHNWYTVFNELKIIEEKGLLKDGGTIFLHDVCWPYGRRDMYFVPESIPKKFRHPYAKKGIVFGQSELSPDSGDNAGHYNVVFEGGPKNGVLTAVEDFLKEHAKKYMFFYFRREYGLGFLVKKKDIKTKIMFIKWYYIIKWYEILSYANKNH